MKKTSYIIYSLIYLFLFIYFIFFVVHSLKIIFYSYQIDYGEGSVLYQAKLLAQGINKLYKDINIPPYINPYYPVFLLINSFFIKIWSISFFSGRLISFISTILIGFLIFKIVYQETKNYNYAFISSLLFFSHQYIYRWAALYRIDMFGIFLGLLGIYFVIKYKNSLLMYFSCVFFILSWYTKQTLIIAPFTTYLFLILNDRKRGIKATFFFMLGLFIIFIWLTFITNGYFFSLTPFLFQCSVKSSISKGFSHFLYGLRLHPVIVGLVSFFIIFNIYKRKISLFLVYTIVSIIFSLLLSGKQGTSFNSFIEVIIGLHILFGLSLNIINTYVKNNYLTILIGLLILFQLFTLFHCPNIYSLSKEKITEFGTLPSSQDKLYKDKLSSIIQQTKGRILSDSYDLLILNGKQVDIILDIMTAFSLANKWDQTKFINDIKRGNYAKIISQFELENLEAFTSLYTTEMRKAIIERYKIEKIIGNWRVFTPK